MAVMTVDNNHPDYNIVKLKSKCFQTMTELLLDEEFKTYAFGPFVLFILDDQMLLSQRLYTRQRPPKRSMRV
jgi:hypothetical protein